MQQYQHRILESVLFPSSGSIKIGDGEDYDPDGELIKSSSGKSDGGGGKMPDRIELTQPGIQNPEDDQPAYITFPDQIMAPQEKQKPIIFSPQIVYPRIKKRVIVHHHKSFENLYKQMFMNSQFYMDFASTSPEFSQYKTPNMLGQVTAYQKYKDTLPEEDKGDYYFIQLKKMTK